MVEEITRYPHENPILVGMLMVVIGLLILVWRIQNPWIPDCPDTLSIMCEDMDFVPIIATALGVMGVSFIMMDLMENPE